MRGSGKRLVVRRFGEMVRRQGCVTASGGMIGDRTEEQKRRNK